MTLDGTAASTAEQGTRRLVVTPTLGRSPFFHETVQSIATLGIALQHVVVAPRAAVAGIAREWPHLTVVPEDDPGTGMYAAINLGVAHAGPWDWFTYLNDDDVLCARFRGLAELCGAPDCGADIVYGDVRYIDQDGKNLGLMPVVRSIQHMLPLARMGISPFAQQGTLISREAWHRLRGFDVRYQLGADLDFFTRAAESGLRMRRYPHEVARWRIHGGQLSMQRERAQSELADFRSRNPERGSSAYRSWVKWFFRMSNAWRYAGQYRLTGTLRSETLFARESSRR